MRIVSCTRAEAEDQLDDLMDGWSHLGNYKRWTEALNALHALQAGQREVTAGHTTYRIQEAQAS